MSFADKVVLVAGSTRGTGRAIALEAAGDGADVVVTGRSAELASQVAAEICAMGRRSVAVVADLSTADDARRVVAETISALGRVDILIYNAAAETACRFLDIAEQDWDTVINTNLKGFFLCAQEAARTMVERSIPGRIVAISSIAGLHGFPHLAHYAASKGGMLGLVRGMAIDLARYHITVNAVAPGIIEGEATERLLGGGGEAVDGVRRAIPLRRFATPVEIARMALSLASDDAAYTTGSVLTVDGGFTLATLPPKP